MASLESALASATAEADRVKALVLEREEELQQAKQERGGFPQRLTHSFGMGVASCEGTLVND